MVIWHVILIVLAIHSIGADKNPVVLIKAKENASETDSSELGHKKSYNEGKLVSKRQTDYNHDEPGYHYSGYDHESDNPPQEMLGWTHSSPNSPNYGHYGWPSYYEENHIPVTNFDPGYIPGPPPKKRRRRPPNLLQILQKQIGMKASRKIKGLQSVLKALGIPGGNSMTMPSPESTTMSPPAGNETQEMPNAKAPAPSGNPAVELLVQLAPTLTNLVDTVGNAVAGEGSLLALKRDATLANFKYKKALFIGLPETIIKTVFGLPSTLAGGSKTVLKVISTLASPPKPEVVTPPSVEMMDPQIAEMAMRHTRTPESPPIGMVLVEEIPPDNSQFVTIKLLSAGNKNATKLMDKIKPSKNASQEAGQEPGCKECGKRSADSVSITYDPSNKIPSESEVSNASETQDTQASSSLSFPAYYKYNQFSANNLHPRNDDWQNYRHYGNYRRGFHHCLFNGLWAPC